MKTIKINNLWIGKYTSSSHGWHSFMDLFCQSLQLYSSWKSEVKDFWRLRYNLRENAGTLGWYPSCLSPPKRPLEGGIPNKYPLYKVYMGLITKGTIPQVPPFSLWYKISSLFLILEGDVLEASVSSDVSGSLVFFCSRYPSNPSSVDVKQHMSEISKMWVISSSMMLMYIVCIRLAKL